MTRSVRSVAAALAVLGVAGPAFAVRFSPGGVAAGPSEVYMTRTITVSVAVEDNSGHGADAMEVWCVPEPPDLVVAALASPPPSFTCSSSGRSEGWFGWTAVKEGTVRFRVSVSLLTCATGASDNVEMMTPPIRVKPVPMDSSLEVSPRLGAPGDLIEVALTLSNRAPEFAVFGLPTAEPEVAGRVAPPAEYVSGPVIEPAGTLQGGHMVLPAGGSVRATWRFRAIGLGDVAFRVVAAGLFMKTKGVTLRRSAVLDLRVPAPYAPSAVGRAHAVRADIGASGDATVESCAAAISWWPADSARLVASSLSSSRIEPSGAPARAAFSFELLKPGVIVFTVSSSAREADTGRPVEADPATSSLTVQAPPALDCLLEAGPATVLAGDRVALRVGIANRSRSATEGLTPMVLVREGAATVQPLSPLYQGVPAGSTAWFTGFLVPEEPGGPVEIVARVTGRGDRGGERVTVSSDPVRILAVSSPRILLFSIPDDPWEGSTGTIRFVLRNAGPDGLRISSLRLALSSRSGLQLQDARPGPVPLVLAPGASSTLAARAYLPVMRVPYEINASLAVEGLMAATGLPFSVQLPTRTVAAVRPRATQVTQVEPEDSFRPVTDPFLFVEWTCTVEGVVGLAVVSPEGRPVAVVRAPGSVRPGRYRELWNGETLDGKLVAPGRYWIRLAGPSPAGSAWPSDAAWRLDRQLVVAEP